MGQGVGSVNCHKRTEARAGALGGAVVPGNGLDQGFWQAPQAEQIRADFGMGSPEDGPLRFVSGQA
jgi:hypothetical protein